MKFLYLFVKIHFYVVAKFVCINLHVSQLGIRIKIFISINSTTLTHYLHFLHNATTPQMQTFTHTYNDCEEGWSLNFPTMYIMNIHLRWRDRPKWVWHRVRFLWWKRKLQLLLKRNKKVSGWCEKCSWRWWRCRASRRQTRIFNVNGGRIKERA